MPCWFLLHRRHRSQGAVPGGAIRRLHKAEHVVMHSSVRASDVCHRLLLSSTEHNRVRNKVPSRICLPRWRQRLWCVWGARVHVCVCVCVFVCVFVDFCGIS